MTAVQFAQKAVVTDDSGRILLVRKSDDDPNQPGRWELPGGRLIPSEDPVDHMIREVREETGLFVSPGPLIDLWSWQMSWRGEHVQVIAVSRYCKINRAMRPVKPSPEADDYLAEQRWFDLSDVPMQDLIPSQVPTIEMVKEASSSEMAVKASA